MPQHSPHRILQHLRTLKPDHDPAFIARYVGAVGHQDRAPNEQSRLRFLGLKIPQLDHALRSTDREGLTSAVLLRLCKKAKYHEELTMLLSLLDELDHQSPLRLADLEKFISVIDNWATSDQLSSIISRALEREGKSGTARFRRWNRSQNPWMRRQSVVGLYYYARQRKRKPDPRFVMAQIAALLEDQHFYVQKGVGWTLRELHQVKPQLQEALVLRNLQRISPIAWFAASENYSAEHKSELVKKRRAERTAQKKSLKGVSGSRRQL